MPPCCSYQPQSPFDDAARAHGPRHRKSDITSGQTDRQTGTVNSSTSRDTREREQLRRERIMTGNIVDGTKMDESEKGCKVIELLLP